jgi:TonB family protein
LKNLAIAILFWPLLLSGQQASNTLDSSVASSIKRPKVVLWAVVDQGGRARDVKVIKGVSKQLDKKAVNAVKGWRFDPAIKDGVPVAVQISLEVEFDCRTPDDCDPISPEHKDLAVQGASEKTTLPAGVFKVGHGVKPPKPITIKQPTLSEQEKRLARDAKYKGTEVLNLVVDETGTPQHIRVVRNVSSELDQKAIEAVSSWRFEPGTKNGKAVPVEINIEVNFSMY